MADKILVQVVALINYPDGELDVQAVLSTETTEETFYADLAGSLREAADKTEREEAADLSRAAYLERLTEEYKPCL